MRQLNRFSNQTMGFPPLLALAPLIPTAGKLLSSFFGGGKKKKAAPPPPPKTPTWVWIALAGGGVAALAVTIIATRPRRIRRR